MFDARTIIKTAQGYERDDGSARYLYDQQGRYLGQFQPDMLSDDEFICFELWLATYPNDRCYHELSPEQMSAATSLGI